MPRIAGGGLHGAIRAPPSVVQWQQGVESLYLSGIARNTVRGKSNDRQKFP